jgi:hypothetical protein
LKIAPTPLNGVDGGRFRVKDIANKNDVFGAVRSNGNQNHRGLN